MADQTVLQQIDPQSKATAPGKISFEEFLQRYDGQRAEWIDGEVLLMSPISVTHDDWLYFLRTLLTAFIQPRNLGKLQQEFTMHTEQTRRGREPDLLFIATARLGKLKPTYLDGPADLAVEIVSADSIERDWETRLAEYAAAGVPEYWIIDPYQRQAALFHLGLDGSYARIQPDDNGDLASGALPGFQLPVAVLWSNPLPDLISIFAPVEKMGAHRSA